MSFLYLYRQVEGVRTRFKFTVDEELNILDELQDPEPKVQTKPEPSTQAVLDPHTNTKHITSVSKEDLRAVSVLTGAAKCWFPGCEEILESYRKALAVAEATSCPPCEKGRIIRKHMEALKKAETTT